MISRRGFVQTSLACLLAPPEQALPALEATVPQELIALVNSSGDIYAVLEAVSVKTGLDFILEGAPSVEGTAPRIQGSLSYRALIRTVLASAGYDVIFKDLVLGVKHYRTELPELEVLELQEALETISKALKRRGYEPASVGSVETSFATLFTSLTGAEKTLLATQTEQPDLLTRLRTQRQEGKLDLNKLLNVEHPTIERQDTELTAPQRLALQSCLNQSIVGKEHANVQRGFETASRVCSSRSEFGYIEDESYRALVNVRKSAGQVYRTFITPTARVSLNFTSSVRSTDPLTEKEPSDPDAGDYLADGSPKPLYRLNTKRNVTLGQLLQSVSRGQGVVSKAALDRKLCTVIAQKELTKPRVVEAITTIFNYAITEEDGKLVLGFPAYDRALRTVRLKQFIEFFMPAALRRFYNASETRQPQASSEESPTLNLTALHDAISSTTKARLIRRFRVAFDAFCKEQSKGLVLWEELPETCQKAILLTFCLEGFHAANTLRHYEEKTLPMRFSIRMYLHKSFKNTFLHLELTDSQNKEKLERIGMIARDP